MKFKNKHFFDNIIFYSATVSAILRTYCNCIRKLCSIFCQALSHKKFRTCLFCNITRKAFVLTGINTTRQVTNYGYPQIIFTFHLLRKPLYYIVNLILPCALLSLIAVTTFILQPSCADRLGLGKYFVRF